MKTKLLLFFIILLPISSFSQHYTISGYITEKKSGETLIGASVYDNISKKGAITNTYGFYSLTLPKNTVQLTYSTTGFKKKEIAFTLNKDTTINIAFEDNLELKELVVSANIAETGVRGSQMSTINIPISQIKSMPAMMGEVDVIKALQMLPGVQSGTEGSSGMYVRGGGPDENLMLLDGVPVYNANHLMGFFSVFNADAIKNVTLYKGSFPARFGSRLSSVIDITSNDGNDKQIHGNASIGLLSSKLSIEGPIIKEKTTFSLSGRRSYIDLLTKPLMSSYQSGEDSKTSFGYYFYDVNAKLTHKINDKHRLFVSFYNGNDVISTGYNYSNSDNSNTNMDMDWNWGNTIGALRWNWRIAPKLFCNTTLNYTSYLSNIKIAMNSDAGTMGMGYKSGIEDQTARIDLDYNPNVYNEIKIGGEYTYHTFKPDVTSFEAALTGFDTTVVNGNNNVYPHEVNFYIEDNVTLNKYIKGNIGLHYSNFYVQQKAYQSLEPRVSARFMLNSNLSLKVAYCEMSQYVHLLASNSISLPTDLWVPVTKRVEPMKAKQFSAGVFYKLPANTELSVEGYYKKMDNLIEYKEGESLFSENGSIAEGWEEKIEIGQGYSYGMEILFEKSVGQTTGWVGYTLAWANRQFDNISFGNVFPAKYDRRHDISVTISHKFSKKFDVAANWIFGTGTTATLGTQLFNAPTNLGGINYGQQYTYYENRNNFRMPNSHRLDLSVNFHKKLKWAERTWNISIFNVYNHKNAFIIFTDYDSETKQNQLKQLSILPILPSVSYSLKF